tara:strand:- start:29 stop:385 length:357 start_codon:yes stop_codon:yes gene_type:complete
MSIHDNKSITTSKKYKFRISEANGNWQDSLGNYGKSRILFYLETNNNKQTYIKGLGQLIDQNNKNIWFIPIRKSDEDAGVGKIEVIESSKLYNFLIQSSCTYAINYFENRSFFKVKCK